MPAAFARGIVARPLMTAPLSTRAEDRDGKRHGWLDRVANTVAALLCAWPILTARWVPFVDYPQHLSVIAVMHAPDSPNYAPYFEVACWKTQYLLFYWLGCLFAHLASVDVATRIAAVGSFAILPLCVAAWLRANNRPPALGALAGAVAIHPFVLWGFLNFALGVSMSLLALAATARVLARPSAVTTFLLAGASLLAFYAHPMTFAWFGVAAVLHAADAWWRSSWRAMRSAFAHCALAAMPLGAAVGYWLAYGSLTDPGAAVVRNGAPVFSVGEMPVTIPVMATLRMWEWCSFGTWTDGSGRVVGVLFACACAALATLRLVDWLREKVPPTARPVETRQSWAPEGTLVMTALLYLFGPFSWGLFAPINWRFLPVLLALAPAIGPRRWSGGTVRTLAVCMCLFVTGFAAITNRSGCARTDAEFGSLDEALARASPGCRLLGLSFAPTSAATGLPLHMHAHSYYQARIGGLASFSFAELPVSPLSLRAATAPPPFPTGFEWNADLYDHSVHGDAFDYWLVRALPPDRDPFAKPSPSGAPHPIVLYTDGLWTLFGRAPR